MLYRYLRLLILWVYILMLTPYQTKAEDDHEQLQNTDSHFIKHTVSPGETLHGLAREYGITVQKLRQYNPREVSNIQVGESLKIPIQAPIEKNLVHVVDTSETLYAIAKKYQVTPEQLQQWNDLDDYIVKIGQNLIIRNVQAPSSLVKSPAERDEKIQIDELREEDLSSTTILSTQPASFSKTKMTGLAGVFTPAKDSQPYVALHATLSIGTIIEVMNKATGQRIFVKVIGRLEAEEDEELMIRISEKAAQKLNSQTETFFVLLSYIL